MSVYPPHPRQTLLDRFVFNTVRDEWGARVRPLRAGKRRAAMRGWARQGEFERVRRGLVPRPIRYPMYVLGALALVGVLVFVCSRWLPGETRDVAAVGFFIAGSSFLVMLPLGLVHQYCDDRASVRAMLAARMCLRCSYDLEGAVTDDAGACVCPECGAAWRLEVGASSG